MGGMDLSALGGCGLRSQDDDTQHWKAKTPEERIAAHENSRTLPLGADPANDRAGIVLTDACLHEKLAPFTSTTTR